MLGRGPLQGGCFSALNVSAPTVIKQSAGQFWSAQVIYAGAEGGAFYDANTLTGGAPANCLATIQPNSLAPIIGPFPFLTGLLFVPFGADTSASIFYS